MLFPRAGENHLDRIGNPIRTNVGLERIRNFLDDRSAGRFIGFQAGHRSVRSWQHISRWKVNDTHCRGSMRISKAALLDQRLQFRSFAQRMLHAKQACIVGIKMALPARLHRHLPWTLENRTPDHDHQATTWLQHPHHLSNCARLRKEHQPEGAANDVKGVILERHRVDAAAAPIDVDRRPAGSNVAGYRKHLRAEVQSDDLPRWSDGFCEESGQPSCAARYVEHVLAWLRVGERRPPRCPLAKHGGPKKLLVDVSPADRDAPVVHGAHLSRYLLP